MSKFNYYSSFWVMWYSEQKLDEILDDIKYLKNKYYRWIK